MYGPPHSLLLSLLLRLTGCKLDKLCAHNVSHDQGWLAVVLELRFCIVDPCVVVAIERLPEKLHFRNSSEVFFVSTLSHGHLLQNRPVEIWIGTPRHSDVNGGCRRLAISRAHRASLFVVCSPTPRLCSTPLLGFDSLPRSLRCGFDIVPIASL